MLLAVTQGIFDRLPLPKMADAMQSIQATVRDELPMLARRVEAGAVLDEQDRDVILRTARHALGSISTKLQ